MSRKIEEIRPLPVPVMRQPDGNGFYVQCNGGFRGSEIADDKWQIEPVLIDGKAQHIGYLSKSEFTTLINNNKFKAIAFQRIGWHGGDYHSSWVPVVPSRKNHFRAPSDLWGSISTNFSSVRTESDFDTISKGKEVKEHEIARLLDNRDHVERLCNSISLSLRSMDINIEFVSEFYNEQLTNILCKENRETAKLGSQLDQNLYAHVHSFFLHFGASRDYLASLISSRLGGNMKKLDSMANLIKNMKQRHADSDPLLKILLGRGDIVLANEKGRPPFKTSSWLKDINNLRNQFTHRRPYGQKHLEMAGWIKPVDRSAGLFRYYRPYVDENDATTDILDLMHYHYGQTCKLFLEMAEASNYNAEMLTLTDKDIISIKRD